MPCLSKILASLATQRTEEEPGVVEVYEVFSLSAAGALCAASHVKTMARRKTRLLCFCFIGGPPHKISGAVALRYTTRRARAKIHPASPKRISRRACSRCVDLALDFNFNQSL